MAAFHNQKGKHKNRKYILFHRDTTAKGYKHKDMYTDSQTHM